MDMWIWNGTMDYHNSDQSHYNSVIRIINKNHWSVPRWSCMRGMSILPLAECIPDAGLDYSLTSVLWKQCTVIWRHQTLEHIRSTSLVTEHKRFSSKNSSTVNMEQVCCLKYLHPSTKPHRVTSQKIITLIFTAIKSLNLKT
jgi:hypothetical protein